MKKNLLAASLLLLSAAALGQSLPEMEVNLFNDKLIERSVVSSRSATCGTDTVYYGLSKATGLAGLSINSSTSAQAVAQYFDCPQPINVSGGTFYAWKPNATGGITQNVQLQLYLAGPDSLPTGSPIAAVTVAVDTVFGTGALTTLEKVGTFSPVLVSQPYCMVVRNASATAISMAVSSYTAGDGAMEWLGSGQIGSTWLSGYEISIGGGDFDADVLIQPLVSYDFDADFSLVGIPCVPANGTAQWQNSSSSILFNRMYSVAAFIGEPELQFSWDYGDGSALDFATDGSHTYSGAPSWNVVLTDSLFAWTITCVDTETKSTADQVTGDFGYNASDLTVDFSDASVGNVTSWSWDFGDGNTSTAQNPQHTYASANSYQVCLTATTDCGSDVYCENVTVSMVTGVSSVDETGVSIYPNPSDGNMTLTLGSATPKGVVEIMDMTGRVVYSTNLNGQSGTSFKLSTELPTGSYVLRMTGQGESFVQPIQVR